MQPDAVGKELDFQMWPIAKNIATDVAYTLGEYKALKSSYLITYLELSMLPHISVMFQIFRVNFSKCRANHKYKYDIKTVSS